MTRASRRENADAYQRFEIESESTPRHCEARSDEAIQTVSADRIWIASFRSQ
jgi:hypothetical protein